MTTYDKFITARDELFYLTFKIKPEQIKNQKVSIALFENKKFVHGSFSISTNGEEFENVVEDCSNGGTTGFKYGEFVFTFQNNIIQLDLYKNDSIISGQIPFWRLDIEYQLYKEDVLLRTQVILCNFDDNKDANRDDCYEFIIPVEVTFILK